MQEHIVYDRMLPDIYIIYGYCRKWFGMTANWKRKMRQYMDEIQYFYRFLCCLRKYYRLSFFSPSKGKKNLGPYQDLQKGLFSLCDSIILDYFRSLESVKRIW